MPTTVDIAGRVLFRVGRAVGPLWFSHANESNRFDLEDEGVLYASSNRATAFRETLQAWRPSARTIAKWQAAGGDEARLTEVDANWRAKRALSEFEVINALPFFDVTVIENWTTLTQESARSLSELGVSHLDLGQIMGPNRELSRTIAAWVARADDERGDLLYGGIRYRSKFDGEECFAVFERQRLYEHSPHPLHLDDPDLQRVATEFGLTLL